MPRRLLAGHDPILRVRLGPGIDHLLCLANRRSHHLASQASVVSAAMSTAASWTKNASILRPRHPYLSDLCLPSCAALPRLPSPTSRRRTRTLPKTSRTALSWLQQSRVASASSKWCRHRTTEQQHQHGIALPPHPSSRRKQPVCPTSPRHRRPRPLEESMSQRDIHNRRLLDATFTVITWEPTTRSTRSGRRSGRSWYNEPELCSRRPPVPWSAPA